MERFGALKTVAVKFDHGDHDVIVIDGDVVEGRVILASARRQGSGRHAEQLTVTGLAFDDERHVDVTGQDHVAIPVSQPRERFGSVFGLFRSPAGFGVLPRDESARLMMITAPEVGEG